MCFVCFLVFGFSFLLRALEELAFLFPGINSFSSEQEGEVNASFDGREGGTENRTRQRGGFPWLLCFLGSFFSLLPP